MSWTQGLYTCEAHPGEVYLGNFSCGHRHGVMIFPFHGILSCLKMFEVNSAEFTKLAHNPPVFSSAFTSGQASRKAADKENHSDAHTKRVCFTQIQRIKQKLNEVSKGKHKQRVPEVLL